MPVYSYKTESGEIVERIVPIAERDNQPNLERLIEFNGSVWAPTSGGMR
ncbi:hypothetical protein FDI69_gp113 [Rhodococcus phage Trina]|uniref:Uncharacterized protein n=1 Tax=Rhodococcus phage Trina TaxID=2027905 RepID=A0A2D1AE08_9CAUD|nr:hypothetical protein FDI69_gp113 [Rhodococcus phage Trina]ASZ74927.1 hypothetical protein SEA_TRINA_113 [Rhodococcus phage Trina]